MPQKDSDLTSVPRATAFDATQVLEGIGDACYVLDHGWRFVYLNAHAERLLRRTRAELLGRCVWDEFPEAVGSGFDRQYRRAVAERVPVAFEEFYPALAIWFQVRACPSSEGLSVFFQDITGQVERGRRERFLAELAERARGLTDPDAVIADAVRSVGRSLGVSRCIFADIDIEADTCTVHASEYRADPASASIARVVPISAFGAFVVAEYAARRAVAVDDVRLDPVRAPEGSLAAYEAIGIRAHVTVPVVHSGRVVSCMSVHSAAPRHWRPEEVELLRAVVERTWLTVEVARQYRALARGAEERREAHERTARILESLSDAFFTVDREWRYTYINRQVEAMWGRGRGDLLGMTVWEAWPEAVGSEFDRQFHRAMTEMVPVAFEEFFPPLGAWLEVRLHPSEDGLSVFFQNVNARKELEAERERLAERERHIAEELQAALTPSVPERVPGLALAKHYEAALAEAGVGGDFYDCFPVEKGCTVLVVGDLSGKGLEAAAQVSTVRNMSRYALYSKPTLAEAVTDLNRILALNGLLTGFATLFVGCYDGATGGLNYVNLGQEPALLRRAATGGVEQLLPTGPVLGADSNASFQERTVSLSPGDALAIFTDGATECGPSRKDMLGIEGVAALLGLPFAAEDALSAGKMAEAVTRRLVGGVDAASHGGVARDDICILVAVAEGGLPGPPFCRV